MMQGVNFLLVAVLAVFFFCMVQGYNKGFLRIIVSLIGTILIIGAVIFVSPYISDFLINKSSAYDSVKITMMDVFKEDNSKLDNSDPINQQLTIESYNVPEILKNALIKNNNADVYKELMVNIFEDYVSGYLARLIIKGLSFVGIYLILKIVLWLALKSVDIISKIPVIKGFNKFLGLIVGFINALIIVWLFFIVIVVFMGNDAGAKLMEEVYKSKILLFLFNENVLMGFIT